MTQCFVISLCTDQRAVTRCMPGPSQPNSDGGTITEYSTAFTETIGSLRIEAVSVA